MLVVPRLACPSWRWMTLSGTPSWASSTAWAWRTGGAGLLGHGVHDGPLYPGADRREVDDRQQDVRPYRRRAAGDVTAGAYAACPQHTKTPDVSVMPAQRPCASVSAPIWTMRSIAAAGGQSPYRPEANRQCGAIRRRCRIGRFALANHSGAPASRHTRSRDDDPRQLADAEDKPPHPVASACCFTCRGARTPVERAL